MCLPYALALAKAFGSKLTLLHVLSLPRERERIESTDALDWEIARQEARAWLEGLREQLRGEAAGSIELRLEQGRPAERVVDVARESGADLTVLASHGEGGATSRNLGSTAQQILASAAGSVFIAHGWRSMHGAGLPRRILIPLDGSLRTESALATGARLAASLGAELLLVHVVAEPVASSVLSSGADLALARSLAGNLEASATRYLERLRAQLAAECAVRILVVRHPNDRQCLLEVAEREHIDLIVLSAHGIAYDPGRSFGGVAADLLSRSTVSLIALQDTPEPDTQRSNKRDGALAPLRVRESIEGA